MLSYRVQIQISVQNVLWDIGHCFRFTLVVKKKSVNYKTNVFNYSGYSYAPLVLTFKKICVLPTEYIYEVRVIYEVKATNNINLLAPELFF